MLPNNKVDVYARINSEVSDLLDDARRAVDIDDSLVNAHFESVPGLGTLTAGGLTGRDLEGLGWQAHGALDAELLRLGALQELRTHLLERLHLARGERDADFVDFLDKSEERGLVSICPPVVRAFMRSSRTG